MEVKIMVEVITLKQATHSLWPVIVFLLGTATLNPYVYGALDEKVFSLSFPFLLFPHIVEQVKEIWSLVYRTNMIKLVFDPLKSWSTFKTHNLLFIEKFVLNMYTLINRRTRGCFVKANFFARKDPICQRIFKQYYFIVAYLSTYFYLYLTVEKDERYSILSNSCLVHL